MIYHRPFRKPVSCHLYPVRLAKVGKSEAVNYHRWQICDVALEKGSEEGIPLYFFLKDALTRKYGKKWYDKLEEEVSKISK